MARRSLFFLPVVMAAVVVASASASTSARDPLSERMHLTKADNALASKISLQRSDLPAGWKPHEFSSKDNGDATCPNYRPDFSSITVTGHKERGFTLLPNTGLSVESLVDVYATPEMSLKDWELSVTSAAAKCLGSLIVGDDPSMRLVSTRILAGPRLGEHSTRFAWVMSVKSPTRTVAMHVDLLFVHQGRVIAGLITISAPDSATGQAIPLSRMVSRMEKPTA